jgi:hypothetical protein
MPYEMKVDGMAEISDMLEKMAEQAQGVASQAVYVGAGIMAEEIRKGAEGIKTAPFKYAKEGTRLPSPEEKAIVVAAGAGIAKFDKNGTEVSTSVGYRASGYAELNGKKKPIPLIVNSINSGTSFMSKQPFVRKAARTGGTKAMAAMRDKIENAFEEMIKK